MKSSYEINDGVRDYVIKVRNAGYKTYICSNNFETRIRELDNKFDFLSLFDVHVFSYEVGYMKPAKEIFETLVKKSGVRPEEIVYSDDDETKMQGAKELGINTFLYTDFDSFVKHLEVLGVKV